jgi:Ca2+-binding RTX toxin-like protein
MRRRSRRRRPFRKTRLAWSLALLVVAAGLAVTATNTVASSRADDVAESMDVNDVKPSQCSAITLNRILTGAGVIIDANGNASLILGSAGIDTISGRNRDDCIVGGAGDDAINGGGGTDVCIGGPGTDTFVNCTATYQ